jgi:general stress protein 26
MRSPGSSGKTAWGGNMEQLTSEARERVLDILRQGRDMTLATIRPDGYPQATSVNFVHDGLRIYAVIGLGSQKAENIQRNDKVSATINLPYADWKDIQGLSLAGRAAFVQGTEHTDHVAQLMLHRFPEVEEFFSGTGRTPWQGVLFLRVDPSVISLIDYRACFGHTELYEIGSYATSE